MVPHYRFTPARGSQPALIDPTQVRSLLPTSDTTTRIVLDGGHSCVVLGNVEETTAALYHQQVEDKGVGGPPMTPCELAEVARNFLRRAMTDGGKLPEHVYRRLDAARDVVESALQSMK